MSLIKINDPSKLNTKLSEHFIANEFRCPCCKKVIVNPILIDKLEIFRKEINNSIIITSAYRCEKHNIEVSNSNKSLHISGDAVDINLQHTKNAVEMLKKAAKIFSRVGIYQSDINETWAFIHVDVKPDEKIYWVCHKIKGIQKYSYFDSIESLLIYLNIDKTVDWNNLVI